MRAIEIKKGEKFGKLTTTGRVESRIIGNNTIVRGRYVECICECGKTKRINWNSLRRGMSKSCGCGIYTHGMTNTKMFYTYDHIKQRCTNPNNPSWERYGGRGIKNLWNSFEEFYNDMSESYQKHVKKYGESNTTIDRIDGNGHYCKENCRWATHLVQSNNLSSNRSVTYKGKTYRTLSSLCREYGIGISTLNQRINKYGWTLEKAIETPIQIHRPKRKIYK